MHGYSAGDGARRDSGRQRLARAERRRLLHSILQNDENTRTRHPWYLAGGVLIALSALLRQPLLLVAGLLLLVIGLVPEVWYRFGFSAFVLERTLSTDRAEIGGEVTLTLRVENRKILPMPWVEVIDELPSNVVVVGGDASPSYKPLRQVLRNEVALLAFQRVVRRYHMRCVARGTYTLGPTLTRSSDPFGLLTREVSYALPARLVVYPLVVPVERLGLSARALLGESRVDRSLLRDPVRVAGVRPYMAGDDPRRLHWKASARTGALQTKVLEPSAQHTVALVLDLRTQPRLTLGHDPALVELLVTTAASVAQWSIEQHYSVGVYSNGSLVPQESVKAPTHGQVDGPASDPRQFMAAGSIDAQLRLRVVPSAHPSQVVRIYEGLARLLPYYSRPIADVLAEEEGRLPMGATVVYCGAAQALDVETCVALERLRRRGYAVTMLVVGDEAIPEVALPVYRVGTRETWERLLDEALALRGLDRRGEPRAVPDPLPQPHLEAEAIQ